jgi:hypothetical protein
MGWGDTKSSGMGDVYFQFDANKKYRARALLGMFGGPDEPISILAHQIPQVKEGDKLIRSYSTQLHSFVDFDPEGLCRCGLCGQMDPLWDRLEDRDKYFKNADGKITGNKHFPITKQHGMFIWSYEHNKVKFLKAGNQLFGAIGTIAEASGLDRDILIWKESTGRGFFNTEYKASALDKAPFEPGVEITKDMLDWIGVIRRELPSSHQALMPYVKGLIEGGRPITNRTAVEISYIGRNRFQIGSSAIESSTNEEEPVKQEPVKQETKAEEPVKQEPVKQEPVKQETKAEEPVKQEVGSPLEMVCTVSGKYNGKTLGEIASIQPNYITWLTRNLKDPKDQELRQAGLQVKEMIESGQLGNTQAQEQPKTAEVEQAADNGSADVSALVAECNSLLQQKINVDDEDSIINLMVKHAGDEVSILHRYVLDKWPAKSLQSLKAELQSM